MVLEASNLEAPVGADSIGELSAGTARRTQPDEDGWVETDSIGE
jgi:hypothetical protein